MTPGAGPIWTQGGLIGRIYVGNHCTLLHNKYISSGLMISEKIFSHYKSMASNHLLGMASLDPRGLIGRIYEWTTTHCYILNI